MKSYKPKKPKKKELGRSFEIEAANKIGLTPKECRIFAKVYFEQILQYLKDKNFCYIEGFGLFMRTVHVNNVQIRLILDKNAAKMVEPEYQKEGEESEIIFD